MFAHWWHHPQLHRLRARFAARRPRHPLARLLLAVLGVALLLFLLAAGVLIGIAMLLGGGLWRALRQRGRPQAPNGRVIEGDFRVAGHRAGRDGVLPYPH